MPHSEEALVSQDGEQVVAYTVHRHVSAWLTGNKSKKLFGLRKKKSAQKTPSNSSSAGDHQGAASRSSTLTGGNSEAVAAADADAVSNSSTLVGMSVLSNSNPMLAEQQALASGGGHRPVSLPSEGKRG